MTKIVRITERLEHEKKKRQIKAYESKLKAIQRTVSCSSCRLKCAMCGRYLREDELPGALYSLDVQFTLCSGCGSEYEDFKRISKNPKATTQFWQKDAWVKMWEAWLSFQKALNEFRQSHEFNHIITNLDD